MRARNTGTKPTHGHALGLMFTSLIAVAIAPFEAHAQNVSVNGANVGNGSYPTLGAAFAAINGGAQTNANILIFVTGSTVEPSTAILNAHQANAIIILPSGGAPRTITGNIAGALIDFAGADHITISGQNSGGNSLTIANTNTGLASTVLFRDDANQNSLSQLTLQGSSTGAALGTVVFSTAAATGNDDNIVINCFVVPAASNPPLNAIISEGTAVAGQENSGNTLQSNRISGYFNADAATAGIFLSAGNDAWTVTDNRLFQPGTLTYTTANTHTGIRILSGSGYSVTNNVIGYATAAQTGTYTMAGTNATRFVGIQLGVGNAAATSVQGNLVDAISLSTASGAATNNGVLAGISIITGLVNIGDVQANRIGNNSGINRIVTTSSTAGGLTVGIHSGSADAVQIRNNQIGGLSAIGTTAAVGSAVAGINISGAGAMTISDNTIGGATIDSLRAGTSGFTTGGTAASGIVYASSPATIQTINNNTIRNLTGYGVSSGTGSYVRGFWTAGASGSLGSYQLSDNQISDLTTHSALTSIISAQAAAAGIVLGIGNNSLIAGNRIARIAAVNTSATARFAVGIGSGNATNTTITRNQISDIRCASTSISTTAPGIAAGVLIRSGATAVTVSNNMITLGAGETTDTAFVGIQANHGSTPDPIDRIYFNTIRIEGTAASGVQSSFGFVRSDFTATARTPTVDLRNNLISNVRSGGSGAHYAIGNNFNATVSATGWPAGASDYNVLNAAVGSVGHWGAALTLGGWQTASAGDSNSWSGINATFVDPASDLHLNMGTTPTVIESGGIAVAGITTDIDGDARPGPSGSINGGAVAADIGADEFDGAILDLRGPTLTTTSGLTREQGVAAASAQVAVVADNFTAAGSLNLSYVGAVPADMSLGSIANNAGLVTASIAAGCTTPLGANIVGLRATDVASNFTDAALTVDVTANTAPVLSYAPTTMLSGGAIAIAPNAGPSDSGSVASVAVQSAGTFTGNVAVDNGGIVSISNAAPAGSHMLSIRVTDNCGLTTDASLSLSVLTPEIFANGFENVLLTVKLLAPKPGRTQSIELPLDALLDLAPVASTMDLLRFSIEGTDYILQLRSRDGQAELRLSQRADDGTLIDGNWLPLSGLRALYLDVRTDADSAVDGGRVHLALRALQ